MDDLSEKEQLEKFREWWSEYGAYVIGGIVIGAGLLFGISQYKSQQLDARLAASSAFEGLIEAVADGDLDEAEAIAAEIQTEYEKTTYAGQSGLAMARLYMDKNRDQDAADALRAVVESDASDELRHVARLRLARIYLYQEKAQDVVDVLTAEDTAAFAAAYGEVLGDAYTALGQVSEAQQAYQEALLDPLSQGTVDQQLVQWKALDLPELDEAAPQSAEPAAAEAVESEESESGET